MLHVWEHERSQQHVTCGAQVICPARSDALGGFCVVRLSCCTCSLVHTCDPTIEITPQENARREVAALEHADGQSVFFGGQCGHRAALLAPLHIGRAGGRGEVCTRRVVEGGVEVESPSAPGR